jgi:uncharacterized OsmC-like protein
VELPDGGIAVVSCGIDTSLGADSLELTPLDALMVVAVAASVSVDVVDITADGIDDIASIDAIGVAILLYVIPIIAQIQNG